jgi:hypothetical protein
MRRHRAFHRQRPRFRLELFGHFRRLILTRAELIVVVGGGGVCQGFGFSATLNGLGLRLANVVAAGARPTTKAADNDARTCGGQFKKFFH